MFTHFVMNENGTAKGFTMTDCEKCGADAQVNAVGIVGVNGGGGGRGLRAALLIQGLVEVDSLPSELGHDEESGMALCDACG